MNKVSDQDIQALEVYDEFLKSLLGHTQSIVYICFNSEFYQRQKIDLLSRLKQTEYPSVKYCLIGNVVHNPDTNTAWHHIKLREKFFKESAQQRNMIPDELCEKNIQNFAKF